MRFQYLITRCSQLIAVIFSFLVLMGCASFRGGELPLITQEQIVIQYPKPTISYHSVYAELGFIPWWGEQSLPKRFDLFQVEVKKVFNKSDLFSEISTDKINLDYDIDLKLQVNGEHVDTTPSLISIYSGFLYVYTLGIIPRYSTIEYTLTAEVKQRACVYRKYEYKDHMNNWTQFPFLLALTPTHMSENIEKEILDNMLLTFLFDLNKDRVSDGPCNEGL